VEIFGHLERLAASLYPLRIPIAVCLALLVVLSLVIAVRLGLHLVVQRHKLTASVVAVAALAVLVPATYYLASPLWIRTSLIEPPAAAPPALAAGESGRVLQRGEFRGADDFHFGRGRALLSETMPDRYTLRVEDFSVRNGPDLFVYLSTNPNGYAADAVNLGTLKASDGTFNYDVPEGTDISRIRSVIVWCRQFSVLFATATLT